MDKTSILNPVPDRSISETDECRFKELDELPLEKFQDILRESSEHTSRTNSEVLDEYFTHIETTHINSMDVERPKLKNRPRLIIMAGPNGAGKTSIMAKLAKHGWLKGVHSSRVAIRVMKGGHSIPIKTIISRYMESLLNTRALVKVSDVSYIFDNSEHNADAKLLMRFRNGKLETQFVDILPRWAQSILE